MDIFNAIYNRRSIRKFIYKDIEKEKIRKIIESGVQAPSACNIQGWKFIIINNDKIKQAIIDEGTAYFVKNAPFLIMVLYDNRSDNLEYADHVQSASAAIQNMQLIAYSLSIGSCCINNLPTKKRLRKILKVPSYYDPIAALVMGYYKKTPSVVPRKYKMKNLISYNKFNFKIEKKSKSKLIIKRTGKFIFYRLPKSIKKILNPLARKFEKRFD
jgi:nitroreductase